MSVLTACVLSFLVVFILLGFLAVLIRLTTALFPGEGGDVDTAAVAAIHAAVAATVPGARVNRIEEIRK